MTTSFDSVLARGFAELGREPPLRRYYDDPAAFARDCIDWGDRSLAGYQERILEALPADRRVTVRGPHGLGKTATTALAILWFALTRDAAGVDWKCLTTAGAWRQLVDYLWPEVHLWARRVRWDVVGRQPFNGREELLALTLKLSHGHAFAGASDDAALLEGLHADSVLIVLDESKSVSAQTFDSVEGAMSGTGEAFALAMSTPGEPTGRFYDLHQRKAGLTDWRVFHVTLAEALTAGQISAEWAKQRALQWGETSAVYQNRALGEFASSDEDSIIPLAWVEAAVDRHRDWVDSGRPEIAGRTVVGVDVARSGADQTVLAVRTGDVVEYLERHRLEDTMATTGYVVSKLGGPAATAVVDVVGVGAGVVDRIREQHLGVLAFNASAHTPQKDRSGEITFLNARAGAWWRLRELLDPTYGSTIALPDDDELIGDLCTPKWRINSSGKLQVEGKDEIRKRLNRSTDAGDAVVMAFTVSGARPSAIPGRVFPWNDGPRFSSHRSPSIFTADPKWGTGSIFGAPDEPFDAPELPPIRW